MKQINDVLDMVFALIHTGRTVFLHSYPDGLQADEFIVVNALSVPADSIQTVDVNVNCYQKSFQRNIPDLKSMGATADAIIALVHGYHTFNTDHVHIAFQFMNVLRDDTMGMHYANLRFQLIFLNN